MQNRDVLAIALATVITVSAWVGFDTFRTYSTKAAASKTEKLTTPINPVVREDVILKIEASQP